MSTSHGSLGSRGTVSLQRTTPPSRSHPAGAPVSGPRSPWSTPDDGAGTLALVRHGLRAGRRRQLRVTLVLALLVLAAAYARIALGSYVVGAADLVAVLRGTYQGPADYIVWDVTLPRAVLGLLTGVAFGMAGHLFQRVLRNPLASPDIMGVSSGAGLGAVSAIVVLGASGAAVVTASLGGAVVLMLAVLVAAGGTRANIGTLVLAGVAAGSVSTAAINGVLTRADIYAAHEAMRWLTGSLNEAQWDDILRTALCLALLLPVCAVLARHVDAMGTGDALASGLGVPVKAVRAWALVCAVALVAVAAAAVGPVAFVAFLSAPIARGVNRGEGRAVHAALVGALLMIVSDYLAAETFPGLDLPVGVVTAAAGAPVLLWLLVARGKADQ